MSIDKSNGRVLTGTSRSNIGRYGRNLLTQAAIITESMISDGAIHVGR